MALRPGSGDDAEGQGADIFISYQRENAGQAKRLAEALRRDHRRVWLDQKLSSDRRWRAEIEGKLKRARCVVAIWSKRAATSGWVNYEAFRAQQEGKLVAVTFDPIGRTSFQNGLPINKSRASATGRTQSKITTVG